MINEEEFNITDEETINSEMEQLNNAQNQVKPKKSKKEYPIPLDENGDIDYSKLIVLRDVTRMIRKDRTKENKDELNRKAQNEYARLNYYIKTNLVPHWKTPRGIALDRKKMLELDKIENRGVKATAVQIDLTAPSQLNCLYKPLSMMTTSNRQCISVLPIKKYIDTKNRVCINLKDYLQPTINLIAKKLECRPAQVYSHIYELLREIYFENNEYNNNN